MADERRERREQAILDAAVRLIGRGGREAITHRSVAAEARVPLGATTYYFDSRDDLLSQAFQHVSRREIERTEREAGSLAGAHSPAQLADLLVDGLVEAVEPDRSAYVAEYELWLEAARQPELRDAARRWCAADQHTVAAALRALGSPEPELDARIVVATFDGLAEEILVADEPVAAADELRPQVRRLLEALLA